jgi:uncharacterized metal-binding protein
MQIVRSENNGLSTRLTSDCSDEQMFVVLEELRRRITQEENEREADV